MLIAAPTGVVWDKVFPGGNAAQQASEQFNLCRRATERVDSYVNQQLRAVISQEQIDGPDFWLTVAHNGNARAMLQRWPVISILGAATCAANAFPQVFTAIPLNMMRLEHPYPGRLGSAVPGGEAIGPNAIIVAPGFVDWSNGRVGWTLQAQYISGWPHASLNALAATGATALVVDDCAGWSLGVTATIFDSEKTETVSVTAASAPSGPGTITTSALLFEHDVNTIVSSMPDNLQWATILVAAAMANVRGLSATRPSTGVPARSSTQTVPHDQYISDEAKEILDPYRRVF